MSTKQTTRRNFTKLSLMGISSFGVLPAAGAIQDKKLPEKNAADGKLKIVCVGAHPGDPEFGCGGTMAKYSAAGHAVTLLYLTRGEASDPNKSYEEMAALRTNEATVSSKVLNAKQNKQSAVDASKN